MKVEKTNIEHIKAAFADMQSVADLLRLLNEVKPLVYGEKAVPFELKQLTWYANPKLSKNRYQEFKIKKKSGSQRSIHAPVAGLKALQKTLSVVLQCVFEPHKAAMGFVHDKSIVDNASLHAGSRYVYNIDLKDFFPSIDQARVWKCLQNPPFNLSSTEFRHYLEHRDGKPIMSKDQGYVLGKYGYYYNVNNLVRLEEENLLTLDENFEIITQLDYFINEKSITFLNEGEDPNVIKFMEAVDQIKASKQQNEGDNSSHVSNFIEALDRIKVAKQQNGDDNSPRQPYSNRRKKLNRLNIANTIAALCCTEMEVERKNDAGEWETVKRNVLPQGAPTSPVITNIVCQRLDYLLTGVAKRFGLKYSRYADDITFSSMHNVYQPGGEFLKELHRIIAEQNFHIKERKTRLQKDGYRKEVTGLVVNDKVNVQKRYIKQLRMWLYYWERYGYERASGFFQQQYIADKGHVKNYNPDMGNVIAGKLDYLKMVKGPDDGTYKGLKERFDLLGGYSNPIDQVLGIWEAHGIESAINLYYKDKSE
jgi:retron-type reverse transcriptase